MDSASTRDCVIIGARHNALVAAALLARTGLSVTVLEQSAVIDGACRTEYPFRAAPDLAASTGAYLLGPFPPELFALLEIKPGRDIELVRRDPHYLMPTLDNRYLLLGSDQAQSRQQFAEFFTEQDARANEALATDISAIVSDVAPAWLEPVASIEDTAGQARQDGLARSIRHPGARYCHQLPQQVRVLQRERACDVRRHRRDAGAVGFAVDPVQE